MAIVVPAGGNTETPPPEYGDAEYWEEHYNQAKLDGEEVYDWCLGWADIRGPLQDALAPSGLFDKIFAGRESHNSSASAAPDGGVDNERVRNSVLHMGVGNSPLPEEMYDAGCRYQTCVDVSPAVVRHMEERNVRRSEIQWLVGDCCDLEALLPSDVFPLVLEKCTLDAMFCNDAHAVMISKFLKEAFRMTAPDGYFVSVSYHKPKDVMRWLQQRPFRWTVTVWSLPPEGAPTSRDARVQANYLYACRKHGFAQESLTAHWPSLLKRVEDHPDSDLEDEVTC